MWLVNEYFKDVPPKPYDVAVVSWPQNSRLWSIDTLLEQAECIVYLGMNDGVTACGDSYFWHYLLTREYLQDLRREKQHMIVYGGILTKQRGPKCLEWEYFMSGVASPERERLIGILEET